MKRLLLGINMQLGSLSKLREVRKTAQNEGKMTALLDGKTHALFPVAISETEYDALSNWVVKEKAAKTIEIGLAYGISALAICEGLIMNGSDTKSHVALDPFQLGYSNCGLQLLTDAGMIDLVEFLSEKSEIVLPRFLSENRQFDFAFVDGSHKFDNVFVDLFYLGQLVRPKGIIFLDDYQIKGVATAASFFVKNLDWTLEEISESDPYHQWAVLRTTAASKIRTFESFVEF